VSQVSINFSFQLRSLKPLICGYRKLNIEYENITLSVREENFIFHLADYNFLTKYAVINFVE